MRLTEHGAALGRAGGGKRWQGVPDAERKRIMAIVRAAKAQKATRRLELDSAQR